VDAPKISRVEFPTKNDEWSKINRAMYEKEKREELTRRERERKK